MTTRIFFDGREYASPEDMPEAARRAYREALAQLADADGNGVPDVLERGAAGDGVGILHSSITVNGRSYRSADELPAPMRRLYEEAMADADRDGVPDVLEGAPGPSGVLRPELSWSVGTSRPGRPDGDAHPPGGLLRVLLALAAAAAAALVATRFF